MGLDMLTLKGRTKVAVVSTQSDRRLKDTLHLHTGIT